MKKIILAGFSAVAMMAASMPASAANWVLDFDNDNNGELARNSVFANDATPSGNLYQRYDGANGIPGSTAGVHITATSRYYNGRTYDRYAVGFDTTSGPNQNTGEQPNDDLIENFVRDTSGTNQSATMPDGSIIPVNNYRNILIIQEKRHSGNDCGGITANDTCTTPDDEADGGILTFDFTDAVDLVGMNIFDIEERSESIMGRVWFYYEGGGSDSLEIPQIGNHNVAFMDFGDKGQNVMTMKVKCAGSCGIDNLTGDAGDTSTGVAEPGALALFGIGLVGMAMVRRRKRAA